VSQFSGNLVNTCSATKHLPLAAAEDIFAADTVDKWIQATMKTTTHGEGTNCVAAAPVTFRDLHYLLVSEGTPHTQINSMSGLLNIKILLETLASVAVDFEGIGENPYVGAHKLAAIKALICLRQHITQCKRKGDGPSAMARRLPGPSREYRARDAQDVPPLRHHATYLWWKEASGDNKNRTRALGSRNQRSQVSLARHGDPQNFI
jgi:hypothetical protein